MGKRAFSAPGKALLVGGYLVLDPKYQSYVVALSSRMHSVVEFKQRDQFRIKVISAQFDNDTWEYHITYDAQGNLIAQEDNQKNNPFVEKTIFNVLNYFKDTINDIKYDITIEIFSDSGFHSKDESITKENDKRKFNFHKKTITKVPKTGLGSSACLVTVLTSALVSVFMGGKFDVQNDSILLLTHNLAQVAHCQAQGKVGSGFDVAAATFGSILYQRFSPDLINSLPNINQVDVDYSNELRKLIDETDWNFTHKRIRLPKGLRLVMGDVKSGSETTKMVAKVKQWYQENYPRSEDVYNSINEGNMKFIEALDTLNNINSDGLVNEIDSGIITSRVLVDARAAIEQIRKNFRIITNEGNVDVEPVVQTQLLDHVLNEKGVLTAMIPGAGGYDAIAIIVSEKCQIQTSTNEIFDNVTFLDLKQEDLGILEQKPEDYENLK
ncbi:related to Phosphomevalonate kinase [Hanseniaspora guilliermondii]|uniref:Phosphomevalonate kinase n=1 Tax=Hanseniaspora guilliermondii TaxID=56406 RepID=A0A1L0B2T2_9ASCO|nr:related to Phosphomevalonate kinase [Hanseniaspora guilliermondii]